MDPSNKVPLIYRVGHRIKFFSNRVFGAWVEATIERVKSEGLYLVDCYFNGASWKESISKPRIASFYDENSKGWILCDKYGQVYPINRTTEESCI